MDLEALKQDISAVVAPANHVSLCDLTNLDECSDESHFLVRHTGENDQVSEEEDHNKWGSDQLVLWCLSFNLFPPTITRRWGQSSLPLSHTKQEEYRKTVCLNLTEFVMKIVKIVVPRHLSKEL